MKLDETYAYLKEYRTYENAVKSIQYEIESVETKLMPSGISYEGVRVQSSSHGKNIEKDLMRLDELRGELQTAKEQRNNYCDRLIEQFKKMPRPEETAVLEAYYICHKTIKDIAKEMGYSPDTTWKHKRKGVIHLSELLSEHGQAN